MTTNSTPPPSTTAPAKTSLEQAIEEVRNGPFSILSDKAQHRIIDLFQAIADERWRNGYTVGYNAAPKK
jgi:hypothetical protein